ncbi:hypothetical protein SAMD00019534_113300 [Acytostelium subglobosum LB1]|uniref:hypothetical protein n=1 Tax=Acytostelium subglobosum LB1 TaxID=1410327 RepID=UPI0006448F9B|nr:hypothetical protein SAMD00019534_113300 [Acytostelium subglobosum LB1]GAM28154.1 hypothetical protein SAMD00019534_113300 [Acytostelium subglobosum LB1]|eukprot:XP_012748788.1 hypothetical protein SAMD00019534_113300 [Acytostelium subglobosum LB1]
MLGQHSDNVKIELCPPLLGVLTLDFAIDVKVCDWRVKDCGGTIQYHVDSV